MGKVARILIVDDDPDIIRILDYILRKAGYDVVRAYGVEDALRKLMAKKCDLVLTDLAMPEVSGVTLIREIKTRPELKGLHVIAVTAHIWGELGQAAGRVGCDGFIAKPFNNPQLIGDVERHLRLTAEDRYASAALS